jgi:hypothetical protein
MGESEKPVLLVGLVRPRDHCTFSWKQGEAGERRTALVSTTHCTECLAALREQGNLLVPEGHRESLASDRIRPSPISRWRYSQAAQAPR